MFQSFNWTRGSIGRNFLTRHYEPLQPHVMIGLADHFQCEMFVDVGANIGVYSLFLSAVPSIKIVHAFEPSPDTFRELSANLALNGGDIRAHAKALSDKPDTLIFGIVAPLSGANSVVDTSLHRDFGTQINVEAIRLDDVLTDRGKRICIKIDVEGHEREALAGMTKFLVGNQIVLQVEDYSDAPDALTAILERSGFEILFRIGPDRYFTNIEPRPTDRELIEIIETASKGLIEANLGALNADRLNGEFPFTVNVTKGMRVQLSGRAARLARRARSTLNRLRS